MYLNLFCLILRNNDNSAVGALLDNRKLRNFLNLTKKSTSRTVRAVKHRQHLRPTRGVDARIDNPARHAS